LDSDGEEEKINPGRGQYSVGAGSLRGSSFFCMRNVTATHQRLDADIGGLLQRNNFFWE